MLTISPEVIEPSLCPRAWMVQVIGGPGDRRLEVDVGLLLAVDDRIGDRDEAARVAVVELRFVVLGVKLGHAGDRRPWARAERVSLLQRPPLRDGDARARLEPAVGGRAVRCPCVAPRRRRAARLHGDAAVRVHHDGGAARRVLPRRGGRSGLRSAGPVARAADGDEDGGDPDRSPESSWRRGESLSLVPLADHVGLVLSQRGAVEDVVVLREPVVDLLVVVEHDESGERQPRISVHVLEPRLVRLRASLPVVRVASARWKPHSVT